MIRRGWLALMVTLLVMLSGAAWGMPSFDQVKQSYRSSDTWLLDRHGQRLQAIRTDASALRGEWVALKDVSPALRTALLLSEDKRFYQHAGVDWQGVGAAAWANLWNSRTRGASTVTMQLAGLLDEQWATSRDGKTGRSWVSKVGQAATALRLEKSWRKDQILEAYLNLVGFRGETVGISALSSALFHKYPSGLNMEEAALAAALLRSPNAPADRVAARACAVLSEQSQASKCPTYKTYVAQVLSQKRVERLDADNQLAPHLARKLVSSAAPSKRAVGDVLTTLDARLQRFARDTLRRHLTELRSRHVEDGAIVVLDNATGEVLAWVGSSGQLSQAGDVDGVTAMRQAGSTLKPFLYEMTIEQKWLTAASLIDDSPVGLSTAAGLYIPQNYDRGYKGHVSVRTALASSLNIPAVRALVLVGPERFGQRLRDLGLPLAHAGDYYGYSLALGSAEVSLVSLANAYRALAVGGAFSPWRAIHASKQTGTTASATKAVMDPLASYVVADVLSDREARVPTFGLDNALATRYWSAVKTGTSKDMRDNWCVGFSRRFTVGVWVGNANGDPMWDVSGVTGAAPIWRAVLDELHRELKVAAVAIPPSPPVGLMQTQVAFERRLEPERLEWFLPGTAQSEVRLASARGASSDLIVSPVDRTIFAMDPDIPAGAQKLTVKVVAGLDRRWRLRMDGKRLGAAVETLWPMWPGHHELELVDQAGQVKASVRFEVRGAQLKPRRPK